MSDWQRDEILKLRKEVERLSGKTGFCLQCEKYAKEVERLREALKTIMYELKFMSDSGWNGEIKLIEEALAGREGRG